MNSPFITYRLFFRRFHNWCWACLLLFGGCIDEISIGDAVLSDKQIVIQGQLLKGNPSFVKVSVSRTADFVARSLPEPVSQAEVILKDDANQQVSLVEVTPGIYQLGIFPQDSSIAIQPGIGYQISVRTAEGTAYESSFETLLEAPQPDSISKDFITREELDEAGGRLIKNILQFFIYTPLESGIGDKAYLRWIFQGTYRFDEKPAVGSPVPPPGVCYIKQGLNLDKVVVFNGRESTDSRLTRFMLMEEEVNNRFAIGYQFTVRQQSLSKEAYEYWNKVSQAISLSGGLFEATPGRITGNISNCNDPAEEVLGYFYVSDERIIKKFIDHSEAGSPEALCDNTFNANTQACSNCLSLPFSTKTIPEDWGQ